MSQQQTYYDILNISPEASALDIVKAYREIKSIYQPNALATFSLYDKHELETINQQIEEAYAVLSNSAARLEYDKSINKPKSQKQINKDKTTSLQSRQPSTQEVETRHTMQSVAIPDKVNGQSLRNIRKAQHISLEYIANTTNIPKAYLKAIEHEDIALLPGKFYLKSYLKQYAASIGLEPDQVWEKYQSQLKD